MHCQVLLDWSKDMPAGDCKEFKRLRSLAIKLRVLLSQQLQHTTRRGL